MSTIYVYHCYGGSHSSVTAAAIHVNLLDPKHVPSKQVLLSLPYYDTQSIDDHGMLQYMGSDGQGSMVFSVGLETSAQTVIPALKNLFALADVNIGQLVFIETMPAVNNWMKLGGVCSRVFGLKGIGRPLVTHGTKLAYYKIGKIVEQAKHGGGDSK